MSATVLLEHCLGDGSSHFDWMIERGGRLITFRVRARIDLGVERFEAERIEDHRAAYLTYEGPVLGGRGEVRRVAAGNVEIEAETGVELRVRGELGAAQGLFAGRADGQGAWHFEFRSGG